METLDLGDQLGPGETNKHGEMLQENHRAFALEEDERGETDLIQFAVDTGDAQPPDKKSPSN